MDGSRFDRLTKTLSAPGSRRRALGGLLAGTLGLLGWHDGDEITAHDLKAKCKKKSGEAKKKCLKKAKQHNATHSAPAAAICIPQCGGKVCGPDGCGGACGPPCANGCCDGGTCADFTADEGNCGGCGIACVAGQLCTQGQCVTGQGSCAAGADICVSGSGPFCSANLACGCYTTMANQTRCGEFFTGSACGQCTSDAECQTLFPTIPGAFCVNDTGNGCGCASGEGFCRRPCTNPT
jgi:hypothetical protein